MGGLDLLDGGGSVSNSSCLVNHSLGGSVALGRSGGRVGNVEAAAGSANLSVVEGLEERRLNNSTLVDVALDDIPLAGTN